MSSFSFTLPDIAGAAPGEIDRIDWILDGQFVGAGQIASNDYYGSYFTTALTPGMHWVGARVRGLDNSILAQSNGVWFETGQETPVVLLRVIGDIGTPNLGINLDPANLILYGKANPVDSLDVFGKYIRNLHIKDGLYPTDGRNLGQETPVGSGKVDFPTLFSRLKDEFGYDGELIIEREIQEGEEQNRDIRDAVEKLKGWGGVI